MKTQTIHTEGIKYAGSKRKLISQILEISQSVGAQSVLDGFAGTTRVSQAFAQSGFRVTCNDVAVWSKVFATCYLGSKVPASEYRDLIDHLNGVAPRDGWFTEHYGGQVTVEGAIQPDGMKRPWQRHNTQRLDAIREEIETLRLGPVEKAVALTSLILALDRVDNTVGHYVSYLKDWSARSYKSLELKIPALQANSMDHDIVQGDIFDLVPTVNCDLAYFDPPYGSNNEKMPPSRVRYASYYHLWTTVCRNDQPELVGKAKRRADCSDRVVGSVFEEFRRNPATGRFHALEAIESLIAATRARWILFSYNSGGRATSEELHSILETAGRLVEVRSIDHRRNVMASMRWTDDWVRPDEPVNREFLFLLENRHPAS